MDLARRILRLTRSSSPMEFKPLPVDDPKRRCPDITRARGQLQWQPSVSMEDGLLKTIAWFRQSLETTGPRESRAPGSEGGGGSSR